MNSQIFDTLVQVFQDRIDKRQKPLKLHDLLIHQDGQTYQYNFLNAESKSDIRSISKTVMTLLVGRVHRLSKEGRYPTFDLDTYVYPIIKDVITVTCTENLPYLKKVQLRHLLTHSVGYEDVLLMRGDLQTIPMDELVNFTVNAPIVHEPGTHYLYSNAGFYLLSVTLQEFLQEPLEDFARREFFGPLGIQDWEWEYYGSYLAGATRLWLKPDALLKISQVIQNQGPLNGESFIPESWIHDMSQPQFLTPQVDHPERVFRRYAYGLGIWLAKENGIVFGHGTDGQMMVLVPQKKAILIVLADQPDLQPIEELIDWIIQEKL